MSLLVDPDWTIHQLRLSYLRRVDDSYGPRIISFPSIAPSEARQNPLARATSEPSLLDASSLTPSATTPRKASISASSAIAFPLTPDSHIAIAGLHDPAKHPEINSVYSPTIVPTRSGPTLRGASGFALSPPARSDRTRQPGASRALGATRAADGPTTSPLRDPRAEGADGGSQQASRGTSGTSGLKYTSTIYGPGRSGALGMRVSGKRADELGSSLGGPRRKRDSRAATALREGRRPDALDEDPLEEVDEDAEVFGGRPIDRSRSAQGLTTAGLAREASGEFRTAFGESSTLRNNGHSLLLHRSSSPSSSRLEQPLSRSGSLSKAPTPSGSTALAARRRRSASLDQSSDPLRGAQNSQATVMTPTKSSAEGHVRAHELAGASPLSPLTSDFARQLGSPSGAFQGEPLESDLSASISSLRSAPTGVAIQSSPRVTSDFAGGTATTLPGSQESGRSSAQSTPLALQPSIILQTKGHGGPSTRSLSKDGKSDSIDSSVSTPGATYEETTASESSGFADLPSSDDPRFAAPSAGTDSKSRANAARPSLSSVDSGSDVEQFGVRHNVFNSKQMRSSSQDAADRSTPTQYPKISLVDGSPPSPGGGLKPPLSEATLLAARSKLRKPSRSHLKSMTLAQQAEERERQQSAWFQSHSLGQGQVAQRHSQPKASALSLMLQKQNESPENPFAQYYSGISGRNAGSGAGSTTVQVYFPWSRGLGGSSTADGTGNPSGAVSIKAASKSFQLNVRKDATMEELIGYSLYCYVDEGWSPSPEENGHPDVRLTTVGWVLRIVEDGEVDDDYPALDRNLTVGKFGGDEFAVCEASAAQIRQHEASQGLINRRASRVATSGIPPPPSSATMGDQQSSNAMSAATHGARGQSSVVPAPAGPVSRLTGPTNSNNAPAGSLISIQGTPIIASSALSRSAMPPTSKIFLRFLITPNAGLSYKTTLEVPSSEIYLADVLELICRKRALGNADEWALIVPDKNNIVVPLDRTVESLQGSHNLALVRRSTLGAQGGTAALAGQSTNPNASIFKRLSEPAHPRYHTPKNVASTYKSWTVNRKVPMFVGRSERTLTIDGEWIHIIPTDTRAFHAQLASFPIARVTECKQSAKVSSAFKLVVNTDQESKRFEMEAEDAKQASEIVSEINKIRRSDRR